MYSEIIRYFFLVSRTVFFILIIATFKVYAEVPYLYGVVSSENGIPSKLFYSIALQESGSSFRGKTIPWPWTLNICGEGIYLDSKEEAVYFLSLAIETGCSVDVGLFQIHWQTHHEKFKSYQEALEPLINMKAGAAILLNQYRRSNNWFIATGKYHSPNNSKLAENYRNKVYSIYNKEFQ